MTTSNNSLSLLILCFIAFFWTAAYLLIIRRSFIDKVHGMPVIALVGNIGWEFYYSAFAASTSATFVINLIWFLIDCILLYQIFKYAPKQFAFISEQTFKLAIVVSLGISLIIYHIAYVARIDIVNSAILQNVSMSALFISMLLLRRSSEGQSLYIALFKGIGSVLVIVLFHLIHRSYQDNHLMHLLYFMIISLDICYFSLLYWYLKKENKNPWRRI